jgi:transposase InsO family protein
MQPGLSISYVARRHGLSRSLVFRQRPTYGYRRIAALIKRERRSGASTPVNAKRVYRLMKKHDCRWLATPAAIAPAPMTDASSPCDPMSAGVLTGLEFTCWNDEVVRVAFALDCHDREVIGWVATTAGISGEMIRDLMVECGEAGFAAQRAPHSVQWLADNGSI